MSIGGFGGKKPPSAAAAYPDRAPDFVVDDHIGPDQAVLYRIDNDRRHTADTVFVGAVARQGGRHVPLRAAKGSIIAAVEPVTAALRQQKQAGFYQPVFSFGGC